MGYVDLLKAAHQAPLVLTDSGGVQKEAYSLGTPCVVLRDTTEWIEQVERGQSALVESPSNVASVASAMLRVGRTAPDDLYGDGHAARSILQCLEGFPKRHDRFVALLGGVGVANVFRVEQTEACARCVGRLVWHGHRG